MQDRNVQFALEIPTADVSIRLTELPRQTFHATEVLAAGIVFRFRHRIRPESADRPHVGAYPPIDGFEDPPLRESGPPPPPLDEAHYNLWTVHIENVDAGVSELWAQMFRYVGDGRVRGAFRLRPAKRLWVGPAELEFRKGEITTGGHDVLRDVEGTLSCKVDDFDTESAVGLDPFRHISSRLQWSAQVANLQAPSCEARGLERRHDDPRSRGLVAFEPIGARESGRHLRARAGRAVPPIARAARRFAVHAARS
jgi:hypothetical protein